MGTLDRILEMQRQGISDSEITTQLQNEGLSPSEINDSFNQAKVKNAVSPPDDVTPEQTAPEGMHESIMPQAPAEPSEVQPPMSMPQAPGVANAPPITQELPAQPVPTAYSAQSPAEYQPQAPQDYYYQETPQAYSQQDYYAPQTGMMDTETISEIAEQVTMEKLDEYKKKVGDMLSFKNAIQDKVDDIDDRLKRIENSIDKLQQAVIGKIGEFGESNAMIHKDLDNLHGTVAKLMNPLIDNYNELKKINK